MRGLGRAQRAAAGLEVEEGRVGEAGERLRPSNAMEKRRRVRIRVRASEGGEAVERERHGDEDRRRGTEKGRNKYGGVLERAKMMRSY